MNFIQVFCLSKIKFAKTFLKNLFCFNEVTKAEVLKEISSINNKKLILSIQFHQRSEYSADTLTSLRNKSLTSSGKFPSNLKLADIAPIYQKKNPQAKENYRQ